MKKILALTVALIAVTFSSQAHAMDLTAAKAQGIVGEKEDGFIAAVSKASPEIQQLVEETNSGRLEVYKETAAKQGIPVVQVKAIAAQKLISLAGSGEYVMVNGNWVKK